MRRALYESAARCGCEARIEDEWEWGGDIFDQEMIDSIRDEAIRMEFNWRDIESQAGHDAYFLATHCPTAMIFVPCWEGISHNEEESATKEDCAAGTQVILDTIIALDQTL